MFAFYTCQAPSVTLTVKVCKRLHYRHFVYANVCLNNDFCLPLILNMFSETSLFPPIGSQHTHTHNTAPFSRATQSHHPQWLRTSPCSTPGNRHRQSQSETQFMRRWWSVQLSMGHHGGTSGFAASLVAQKTILYTLWQTNIAMGKKNNILIWLVYQLSIGIFNSYLSFPEGIFNGDILWNDILWLVLV